MNDFNSFLEAYSAAWSTHDGDVLAALFTADADLIMGNLPRVAGRDAISRSWKTYFSRISEDRKGEFTLASLREVAPGVRVVNVDTKTHGFNKEGDALETRLARGTWVVVKQDGKWQIAAMVGLPAAGEQRVTPGTDR